MEFKTGLIDVKRAKRSKAARVVIEIVSLYRVPKTNSGESDSVWLSIVSPYWLGMAD